MIELNPLFGKVAAVVNLLVYILIRAPHGNRLRTLATNESRRGRLELWLLIGATLGTVIVPMVWVTTGFWNGADYPLTAVAFVLGIVRYGGVGRGF